MFSFCAKNILSRRPGTLFPRNLIRGRTRSRPTQKSAAWPGGGRHRALMSVTVPAQKQVHCDQRGGRTLHASAATQIPAIRLYREQRCGGVLGGLGVRNETARLFSVGKWGRKGKVPGSNSGTCGSTRERRRCGAAPRQVRQQERKVAFERNRSCELGGVPVGPGPGARPSRSMKTRAARTLAGCPPLETFGVSPSARAACRTDSRLSPQVGRTAKTLATIYSAPGEGVPVCEAQTVATVLATRREPPSGVWRRDAARPPIGGLLSRHKVAALSATRGEA